MQNTTHRKKNSSDSQEPVLCHQQCGTLPFVAPEVLKGEGPPGCRGPWEEAGGCRLP